MALSDGLKSSEIQPQHVPKDSDLSVVCFSPSLMTWWLQNTTILSQNNVHPRKTRSINNKNAVSDFRRCLL